ncbi:MAG: exodeoxyribonuclease VII large subunit [Waddliaceae bacterium]|nr:exodeoxyribonuclease VII large subunit [Waddliaceae bacterium]
MALSKTTEKASARFPILTVSQLTQAIKLELEEKFPLVQVRGEVSNFRQQSSGHLYFTLKDSGAQVSAVMFRADAALIKQIPKDGAELIVEAELSLYPPRGNYQLVVRKLQYAGVGELLLRLEELKVKIHKKGWFAKEHKKPIPAFPKRIGIVSSPTGAAIRDILNVLTRRFSGLNIILNPVKVQGEGAAKEIAEAIEQFNEHSLADVLLVGRGGGSVEDLWAFNEEIVAEAIFHSKIPIICAVGHEIDHCIAEYVADLRAPTPSAAAELVISEKQSYINTLQNIHEQIRRSVFHLVQNNRQRLNGFLRHPLLRSSHALLGSRMQQLDDLRESIDFAMRRILDKKQMQNTNFRDRLATLQPMAKIRSFRKELIRLNRSLDSKMLQLIRPYKKHLTQKNLQMDRYCFKLLSLKTERLQVLSSQLNSIDPKNLLKKGYSILFSEKKSLVISTSQQLKQSEKIRILLSDGELSATLKDIESL